MSVKLYSLRKYWGVCKCGHYDWQHSESIQLPIDKEDVPNRPDRFGGIAIRAEGHGECAAQTLGPAKIDPVTGHEISTPCPCKQFTWVKNVPNPYPAIGVELNK